jgi:nitroreductase
LAIRHRSSRFALLVQDALLTRKSIRAFKSDPVPRAHVEELLTLASRAPSGTNVQPWKVHVVGGDARRVLEEAVLTHRETEPEDVRAEFPRSGKRKEPYTSRMKKLGKEMYTLIGIPKGDQAANWNQWGRNYKFFDAPVGLIFTIDKDLDRMSYVDLGIFLQSFMLAAKSRGLDTCAQGAWNNYWTVTRRVLNIPDEDYIVCGLSLGYADAQAPVNALVSEREPVSMFATFHGF